MAVSAYLFGQALAKALNKEVSWSADTIKIALVKNTYTPNQDTHTYWSDVVAQEATGTGYTAGGATLASKTVAYDGTTNKIKLTAADVSWPTSTVTARYAVIYDDTPSTNATKPVLGYVDFGADQSTSSTTFQVSWATAGIFEITVA